MIFFKRGARKVCADYKMDEIYTFYKERYGDKALPRETVHEIYKKLFPEIIKLIVFENLDYRMPARLGSLRVKKKLIRPKIDKNGNLDARRLSVDYKATKRYWEKLYLGKTAEEIALIENKPLIKELNEHSNNYRLTFWWDKVTSNVTNQSAYYLKITRDNSAILSHANKLNSNLNYYT
jgi:hypothetical protein